jgi:DNA primase
MDSVDGRARLAELARPLVSRIPAGIYKELLIERLAESVGLPSGKLDAILARDVPAAGREKAAISTGLRARSQRATTGKPSIVRRAITLLLHHPVAAGKLHIERLAGVNKPGTELLRNLIETVQEEPNITTAGLLERWRTHEEGRHLGKLAAVEIPTADDFDAAAELSDCLAQLELAGDRERISFLIEKERLNSLSDDERGELRGLGRRPA